MKRIFCDLSLCLGCKTCELACAIEHSKSKELFGSILEKETPRKRIKVGKSDALPFPVKCQHCDDAPCVAACISGAMHKDQEGRTAHDAEKCVGCWMCVMVCPFGAPVRDGDRKVVFKCDLCPERDVPACVAACPTRALFFGTISDFESKLSKEKVSRNELRHNRK